MSLSDVSAEVAIANTLRSLCDAGGAFQRVLFHLAAFLLAAALMRLWTNGQSVVWLHVAVAACQSYAEAGHRAVHPLIVSEAQDLSQPIAGSTASQFELLREALADNQRLRHPTGTHTLNPWGSVFTLFWLCLRTTRIWYHTLSVDQLVDVMLATLLEELESFVEHCFGILRFYTAGRRFWHNVRIIAFCVIVEELRNPA